ncbi:hypothetical protein FPV67DRAFT_881154 [Lyophyllum atratum]|nr:hypothetical protein FPV67DRAFT_881154 [Lyophyllum atratum]
MATVVERPMSALSDDPVLPQHRRRPSIVEVIDVDLFDAPSTSSSSRPTPRPASRQQDPIFLIDSDDEEYAFPVASGSSTRPGHTRQRLTSPPPPATGGPSQIPPVPRVPRRYSGLTSLPSSSSRRPPPFASPPVVRPMNEPFAFEAGLRSSSPAAPSPALHAHPNRHRRVPYVEVRAEPQPHQIPSLGLGGALMTINRARENRTNMRREGGHRHVVHSRAGAGSEPPGFLARAGHTMRRLFTRVNYHGAGDDDDDDEDYPGMQIMLAHELGLDGGDRFDHPARGFALQEMLFRSRDRIRQRHQEPEYKPEYTHPGQPEAGFTFDFAPPEPEPGALPKVAPIIIDLEGLDSDDAPVAGPSTQSAPASPASSVHTLLVCARCLDPLVLGGGLVGEEGRKKKVWALRCGHMIDGKCLDVIGNPENAPTLEVSEDLADVLELDTRTGGSVKGKSRARAEDMDVTPPAAENTMRSRLRSRHSLPGAPVVSHTSASTSTSVSATHTHSPTTLGKRKRPLKPRIEATHEWKCPVAGCGRIHASVKLDGSWVPEPASGGGRDKGKTRAGTGAVTAGRGAIVVFV